MLFENRTVHTTSRKILSEYTAVGALATSFVLTLDRYVNYELSAQAPVWIPEIALRVVAGTGAFVLAYKFLTWLYFSLIWRRVNAREFIGGTWAYRYIDQSADGGNRKDTPMRGVAEFRHSVEGVSVMGYSLATPLIPGGPEARATWEDDAAALNDGKLVFAVALRGNDQGPMEGFVRLHLVTEQKKWGIWQGQPKRMVGHFFLVGGGGDDDRYSPVEFTRGADTLEWPQSPVLASVQSLGRKTNAT